MGTFARGDVIIAELPYADLSGAKRRPVLVLAAPAGLHLIVCMITSKVRNDGYDVPIADSDMVNGALLRDSSVRPAQIFALDPRIVSHKAGTLSEAKTKAAIAVVVNLLKGK